MCRKAKVSRFFCPPVGAVEEALKTAKSSAAAANKYAIFLLSCLSGCQPFAVCRSLYSSLALPGPHPLPEPEQELEPELEQEPLPVLCRIQVGEATERQTKKSNKATDAYQCNLMSVYICSFFYSFAFLSSFFPHIPFDWISIWLQFFVSAEWWHGEISDSWMVNSLGFVGVSCGSFCCQPIELSAKFFGCSLFLQYWWMARLTSWWISLQNIAEYLLCMRLIHI